MGDNRLISSGRLSDKKSCSYCGGNHPVLNCAKKFNGEARAMIERCEAEAFTELYLRNREVSKHG